MTLARHQMARAACERASMSFLNDRRRRRMLVGKPVGRIEQVVDLRRRVTLRAAGQVLRSRIFSRDRAVNGGKGPRGLPARLRRRLLAGHRQGGYDNYDEDSAAGRLHSASNL